MLHFQFAALGRNRFVADEFDASYENTQIGESETRDKKRWHDKPEQEDYHVDKKRYSNDPG